LYISLNYLKVVDVITRAGGSVLVSCLYRLCTSVTFSVFRWHLWILLRCSKVRRSPAIFINKRMP